MGRLARGFVLNINDERLRETIRIGRERGETLRDAFEAAWRGAAEEWRTATEERASEKEAYREQPSTGRASGRYSDAWWTTSPRYTPKTYPPSVLAAYHRLGLGAGSPLKEVSRKRRELVKRYHPDRFVEPEQRRRAEGLTAEINSAHDTIERHLLRR
jgi:hypothetical protein